MGLGDIACHRGDIHAHVVMHVAGLVEVSDGIIDGVNASAVIHNGVTYPVVGYRILGMLEVLIDPVSLGDPDVLPVVSPG